jgi:hypothetical protein
MDSGFATSSRPGMTMVIFSGYIFAASFLIAALIDDAASS